MTYKLRDEHGRFLASSPTLRRGERDARAAAKRFGVVAVCEDRTNRIVLLVQRDGKNVTVTRPDQGEADGA